MKRFLSLLLCALMLLPTMAACSSDDPADTGADTTAADTTTAETEPVVTETAREDTKDNLPADLNLGGQTITISTRNASSLRYYDIDGGGEISGDIVRDAVYNRNLSVEKRLNVTIAIEASDEKWQDWGKIMESTIMAGDDTYQLYFAQGNASIQSKRDHLFQDVSKLKYIDYEQPWWWTDSMKELSLDGSTIRYLIGDVVLNNYTRSGAILFNKELFEDALGDPESLYQLVLDGGWTIDKLREYSEKVYVDLNGDGAVNTGDRYGFIVEYPEWLKYLEYAGDYTRYTRHEDGYPVVAFDQERAQAHLEKLNQLFWETTGTVFINGKQDRTLFTNGSTVFYPCQLNDLLTEDVRAMEAEYGVIPYPKQDDKQENYTSMIQNAANLVAVPRTCTVLDEVGAVVEALCAESYRSVVEKFYDTALKTKYVQDSKSGQCIDLIISTSKVNFYYHYSGALGATHFLFSLVPNNSNDFASLYASKIDAANKKIVELVEQYKKLDAE